MPQRDRMTAVVETTDAGFDVIVEHNNHQSFSRAVDPFGMKAAYKHLRNGGAAGKAHVARVDGDYAFEDRPTGKDGLARTASRLRFVTGSQS